MEGSAAGSTTPMKCNNKPSPTPTKAKKSESVRTPVPKTPTRIEKVGGGIAASTPKAPSTPSSQLKSSTKAPASVSKSATPSGKKTMNSPSVSKVPAKTPTKDTKAPKPSTTPAKSPAAMKKSDTSELATPLREPKSAVRKPSAVADGPKTTAPPKEREPTTKAALKVAKIASSSTNVPSGGGTSKKKPTAPETTMATTATGIESTKGQGKRDRPSQEKEEGVAPIPASGHAPAAKKQRTLGDFPSTSGTGASRVSNAPSVLAGKKSTSGPRSDVLPSAGGNGIDKKGSTSHKSIAGKQASGKPASSILPASSSAKPAPLSRSQVLEQLGKVESRLDACDGTHAKEMLRLLARTESRKRPLYGQRDQLIRELPGFWPTVLAAHPATVDCIAEEDVPVLQALQELGMTRDPQSVCSYTLRFQFKNNPLLATPVITVKVRAPTPDSVTVSVTPSSLSWKSGTPFVLSKKDATTAGTDAKKGGQPSSDAIVTEEKENKPTKQGIDPSYSGFFSRFYVTPETMEDAAEFFNQIANEVYRDAFPLYCSVDDDDSDSDGDDDRHAERGGEDHSSDDSDEDENAHLFDSSEEDDGEALGSGGEEQDEDKKDVTGTTGSAVGDDEGHPDDEEDGEANTDGGMEMEYH